jgi:hypothetical protein
VFANPFKNLPNWLSCGSGLAEPVWKATARKIAVIESSSEKFMF